MTIHFSTVRQNPISRCDAGSGLKDASSFKEDLGRVLLDTADQRKAYYHAKGRDFDARMQAATDRILASQYGDIDLAFRETLVRKLVEAYDALLACDQTLYQSHLGSLQDYLVSSALVKQPAKPVPLKKLKRRYAHAKRVGLGRFLDTSIKAESLNCQEFDAIPFTMPFQRLVLDPGHFGGTGVADSREFKGYREGRAAFIVANLAKAYLVQCLGVDSASVILTRDNLYSIYGNGFVTFGNVALMDYRTELIAALNPDAVISVHTDGGAQRIKSFYPGESPVYYFYRNRRDVAAPARTVALSGKFSLTLVSGLEQKLHMSTATRNRKQVLMPEGDSFASPGRSKVFQNVLDREIPLALLEGISHESDAMVSRLTNDEYTTESVWVGGVEYRYNPLLRWYAEGIVCGLIMYAQQADQCS